MFDRDVVIVGGGPAGLTAGTLLAGTGHRVLLLEKEDFGGYLKKVERFNGHPDYTDGVSGPEFAEKLIAAANASGLEMEFGHVTEIESYSSCLSVTCADGRNYTSSAVIIAGGRQAKKLNVPGEAEFLNKGVIHCVLCDAALYAGKTVAICGGGNTGVSEALLLARYASRVMIIEQTSSLTALEKLQETAASNPKLDCRYTSTIEKISGDKVVESIEMKHLASGKSENIPVEGVVIAVGYVPDTEYLAGTVPLDDAARVQVPKDSLQTEIKGIFAIGDIRTNTSLNLIGAVKDGEQAGAAVSDFLESERS